jgi:hypothetical protein
MREWWAKDDLIPALNVSLFGFPSQRINVEWVGDLNKIRQTLLSEGWSVPPDRDWISIVYRISDVKSGEFLPLVSPQYLDERPVLILTRTANGSKKLIVIRLWAANRTIKDSGKSLWVGTVGVVPRTFAWLQRKKHTDIDMKPGELFTRKINHHEWEWKMVTAPHPTDNRPLPQNILLIREKK